MRREVEIGGAIAIGISEGVEVDISHASDQQLATGVDETAGAGDDVKRVDVADVGLRVDGRQIDAMEYVEIGDALACWRDTRRRRRPPAIRS